MCRAHRSVVKLMGSVGGNIQCVARPYNDLLPPEGCFHLTFENDKCLLKVVTMRRRATIWRDVHFNYAEASSGIFALHRDGVGIADQSDVGQIFDVCQRHIASEIVWWNCWWISWHFILLLWREATSSTIVRRFQRRSPHSCEARGQGVSPREPPRCPSKRNHGRSSPGTSHEDQRRSIPERSFASAVPTDRSHGRCT